MTHVVTAVTENPLVVEFQGVVGRYHGTFGDSTLSVGIIATAGLVNVIQRAGKTSL